MTKNIAEGTQRAKREEDEFVSFITDAPLTLPGGVFFLDVARLFCIFFFINLFLTLPLPYLA